MPEVLIPDRSASGYRYEYRFSPVIESNYRALPSTLPERWDAFGSGAVVEVPLKAGVRGVEGTALARIRTYERVGAELVRRFRGLRDRDKLLTVQVRRSLTALRAGREHLGTIIHRFNWRIERDRRGQPRGAGILARGERAESPGSRARLPGW